MPAVQTVFNLRSPVAADARYAALTPVVVAGTGAAGPWSAIPAGAAVPTGSPIVARSAVVARTEVVVAAVPVPVVAPAWVPVITGAPKWGGPGMRLSGGRNAQAGQTQAGGQRECRCCSLRKFLHALCIANAVEVSKSCAARRC